MSKKILAIISVILAFAMLFGFAGCQSEGEEETTYAVKTPLPIENRTEIDEAGVAQTLPTYSPEEAKNNTVTIFDYLTKDTEAGVAPINELKTAKAAVKIGLSKGITKAKNEKDEDIPYSDNDTLNASIKTLSNYMLITGPTEEVENPTCYVGMDKTGQIVVFDGETEFDEVPLEKVLPIDAIAALTIEDVESVICVDEGPLRTVTVTLKDNFAPEMVEKLYNQGLKQDDIKKAVLAELKEAEGFMKVADEGNIGVEYDNCQLIITINREDDTITAVEYIKRANITAVVTGAGTLEGLKETPIEFCYESFLKYELDRVDPATVE